MVGLARSAIWSHPTGMLSATLTLFLKLTTKSHASHSRPIRPAASNLDARARPAGRIGLPRSVNGSLRRRASSWEQMTDLPRGLREQLASEFDIWSAEIAVHRKDDDGTEKLLLTLADGLQLQPGRGTRAPARRGTRRRGSARQAARAPCKSNACCCATTKAIAACASARRSAVR